MVKKNKFITILHISKLSYPSKGGVENYIESLILNNEKFQTNILSNSEEFSAHDITKDRSIYYKIKTLFVIKSQPISFDFIKIARIIRQSNIIHIHFPNPTLELILILLYPFFRKIKIVTTYHANPNKTRWRFFAKFYNLLNKLLFNISEVIIVTSKNNLISSNIPKKYWKKVKIIPIGISMEKEEDKSRNFPSTKFKILFVGKLRKYKGINYLIEAIKNIDVELNIVGKGEYFDRIKRDISRFKLEDKVFIHTNIDDNQISDFYQKSDLFVLPSIDESETFGIVQLEAMKYGLPIINTNINSGVPEVSLNNYTGLTVSPKSSSELKRAIVFILNNPEKYEYFSKNTFKQVHKFNNKVIKDSYRICIEELI
jgi:glycosyltransferase involved in cell wall biosynthesis